MLELMGQRHMKAHVLRVVTLSLLFLGVDRASESTRTPQATGGNTPPRQVCGFDFFKTSVNAEAEKPVFGKYLKRSLRNASSLVSIP